MKIRSKAEFLKNQQQFECQTKKISMANVNFLPIFSIFAPLCYLRHKRLLRLSALETGPAKKSNNTCFFHFNFLQATRDAGEIAGLNVLRIINEPTAAAGKE